jgi:hypothetical protein
MNRNERDRQQKRRPEHDPGIGNSEENVRGNVREDDGDLQREGNLGNERNRNEPDRDWTRGSER